MQYVRPLLCFVLLAAPLAAQQTRPITFEVRVPANATVMLDEMRTTSTGESREYQTPPVAVGKTYAYTLRATVNGRTITRTVTLVHERPTVIDLRAEFAKAETIK